MIFKAKVKTKESVFSKYIFTPSGKKVDIKPKFITNLVDLSETKDSKSFLNTGNNSDKKFFEGVR